MHNRSVARSAARSQRLELGVDVTAILRPEEAMRLHELRDIDRVRCSVCREWIAPGSSALTTVSAVLDGDRVAVEFSHAECSPSHANLAALVVLAGAEPLGIQYAQALHPDAGAVLLWERMLDLRVRAGGDGSDEQYLYLDTDWWEGFHPALAQEPVRLLAGWLLVKAGEDLVLRHGDAEAERFHGAIERSPPGWLDSLDDSGFCLLIVGAGIGLSHPTAASIQRAIREGRALMGLAEVDL
jgi:hypothetical protein